MTKKLDTGIRQEQIAQAALDLMTSRGIKGLSLAVVAQQVGLVPSSIYRHFKNKDKLLEAVLGLIQERILGNVTAVCAESVDSLERLKSLFIRHVRVIHDNQAIPRLIFSDDFSINPLERKARVYGIINRYLDRVAEIVRQGQQEKQIRQDIDPVTVSIIFLGLIQQAGVLCHLSNGNFDIIEHLEKSWQIFYAGIKQVSSS